jgi:hypothetical protein
VFRNWAALSPEQQTAVRARLDLPDDFDPTAPLPAVAPDDGAGSGGSSGGGRSAGVRRNPASPYEDSLRPTLAAMERHLGPLGAQLRVVTSNDDVRGFNGMRALADTILISADVCRIRVYPAVFPVPSGPSQTLAHELFHCFQQRWRGSPLGDASAWIQEGTAEWAAATVTAELGGTVDPGLRDWTIEYYMTPRRPLFSRTYDAFGWFAYVAESTGPIWDRLRAVVIAGSNEASFAAATGGASGESFDAGWASSQVGDGSWGERWMLDGPGVPPIRRQVPPPYPPLGNGANVAVTAPGYGTGPGSARLEAELTKFNAIPPTVGYVRLGGSDRRLSELTGTTWCTGSGSNCTCPPGTRHQGQTFPRLPGGQMAVSVGGGAESASLTIQGVSLEDECGGRGACPVGKFKMNAIPTGQPFTVESGGTGTLVTVDPSGLLTMDFSEYVPLVASNPRDTALKSYMNPSGFVTAHVTLPADGTPPRDVPIEGADGSTLGGSGRIEDHGQVVLEMTGADMRSVALAAGGAYGNALLSCVDDDTLTISAGGIVQTYERVA